jgi:hypothetical protein
MYPSQRHCRHRRHCMAHVRSGGSCGASRDHAISGATLLYLLMSPEGDHAASRMRPELAERAHAEVVQACSKISGVPPCPPIGALPPRTFSATYLSWPRSSGVTLTHTRIYSWHALPRLLELPCSVQPSWSAQLTPNHHHTLQSTVAHT